MATNRIEQSIDDIYDFIESCKMQPLSSTKVVVPKDELYDLLDELKMRTPEEIKRYKKVISNREAILADARKQADEMLADAQKRIDSMINDSEMVQQAYFQANKIVSQATEEAVRITAKAIQESDQVRISALAYTNDLLADAEAILSNAYESAREKYEGLLATLKFGLETIASNRAELGIDTAQNTAGQNNAEETGRPAEGQTEEEFEFNADTFLKDI